MSGIELDGNGERFLPGGVLLQVCVLLQVWQGELHDRALDGRLGLAKLARS